MEENVALDSSKQKQFVKSIKGIKKLIKKNDVDAVPKTKEKREKRLRPPRGLVYLGHIPHGFYEHQMTQYFTQFGHVTNVRVIRSKRTGRSKGYAFVEFKDPDIAEVVAETMNNYLMGKRLIKAASIPPEKQRHNAVRRHWNAVHNPTNEIRMKLKKKFNTNKDEKGDLKKARQILKSFLKTKKKLNALGINYDIFSPVDVPEVLSNLLNKPDVKIADNAENDKKNIKKENDVPEKNNKQVKDVPGELNKKEKDVPTKLNKKEKYEPTKLNKEEKGVLTKLNKKNKTNKIDNKIAVTEENSNKKHEKASQKKENTKLEKSKSNKKDNKITAAVKIEQNLKDEKLKAAGVKPVENFIKINEQDSDDSDSEFEFDSDEFEKLLNDEDENDSELESADDNSEDEESKENDTNLDESDEDEVLAPITKVTTKTNNKSPQEVVNQKSFKNNKRKAIEKPAATVKKSKFENRNTQKLRKKQFKKIK